MNLYPIDRIARDVRVCMDRNCVSAPLLDARDPDTLSVDEVILSKIPEAVRRVHSGAPAHLLDPLDFSDRDPAWNGDGTGFVLLPDDFMRFVAFRMSGWRTAVWSAITTDDEEYELQRSPFIGLRGNPDRPVVAVAVRPEGLCLEFYSCRGQEDTVALARYMPLPKVEDDRIGISARCYEAAVYTAAALALTTFGDSNGAQSLLEAAGTLTGQQQQQQQQQTSE
ncbi:MAG: hypothetical protein LUE27_09030 [Clostridia bacterium]|nr:hypothetical protein [Clostridia bacterium]